MGASALQEWIGRTTEAEDVVTPRLVASFHATFAPHLAPSDGSTAPLGIHWCLAPETVEAVGLGPDGHPARGSFLPPVPLPRRMSAGGELTLIAPLHVNDRVQRRSTIQEIAEKHGRSGPLCFVTVLHELRNESGPVVLERQVIVYRDPQPVDWGAEAVKQDAFCQPMDHMREVSIDPVLLFRYSALTFNGHRIHYDTPYATQSERYAGLVIHGPLQATLLLNLAATIVSHRPRSFMFRAVRPAIGCQTLRIGAASLSSDEMALAAEAADGQVTMKASVTW
ncbi:FAS1-like dehydratase domain-containing protein [Dongia deserti]|uniref:FAS1-like dehydratase domain-containing protein n=1 Tax=Dongia deserti TaxID=2268030 RepID=UPI000E65C2E3|nr:MaoC family dehydratase N-terminal domain-containing protein [Dongia deserti]